MKVSNVSTTAINQALRHSMMRMQADLVKSQQEAQSLQVADRGLALGIRSGQAVSLVRDIGRLEGLIDANELVQNRLSTTQNALSQIGEASDAYLTALTASISGDAAPATSRQAAMDMLETLTGILNSSYNGEHLFAGLNTDVRPLADWNAAGSPNRQAFRDAFQAEFGVLPDDPAAAAIAPSAMEAFLAGAGADEFLGAGWSANWSSASDRTIQSRISLNETAQTSVSANEPALRKLAMAAAIVTELFSGNLNETAMQAVAGRATQLVGEALADLSNLRATTGIVEERVKRANERMQTQVGIFETFRSGLEGVDPFEAASRVNALLTQIETSYALTARIQQLSLLRFMS